MVVVIEEERLAQGVDPDTKKPVKGGDQPPAYGAREGTYHVPVSGEGRPLLSPPAPNSSQSAYHTSGSAPPPPPPGGVPPVQPAWYYYRDAGRREGRESPAWRFAKALCIAVLVWMLFGAFVRSLLWALGGGHGRHGGEWGGEDGGYAIPDGLELSNCLGQDGWRDPYALNVHAILLSPSSNHSSIMGSNFPYASTTSFELPVDSESLYLLSRGSHAAGSLDVLTAADQSRDTAKVVVTVKYYKKEVRDKVKVCRVSRGEGENGVGIFTPRDLPWKERMGLLFETVVILPELEEKDRPLWVKKFETDLPNFNQAVHDTARKVLFGALRLNGTNGNISAQSVVTMGAIVDTTNGGISGSFNSTGDLSLTTSNGNVKAVLTVVNTDPSKTSKLHVKSTNGNLDAFISLLAQSRSSSSTRSLPVYEVDTLTTNGKLLVTYKDSPVDSILYYKGASSNGRAEVQLHPTFQGPFRLQTSNGKPSLIVQDWKVPDPSGKGRTRNVISNMVGRNVLEGRVQWVSRDGEKDSAMGRVDVTTSNAGASLVL